MLLKSLENWPVISATLRVPLWLYIVQSACNKDKKYIFNYFWPEKARCVCLQRLDGDKGGGGAGVGHVMAHVDVPVLAASQPLQDAQLGPLDAQRLSQPHLINILSQRESEAQRMVRPKKLYSLKDSPEVCESKKWPGTVFRSNMILLQWWSAELYSCCLLSPSLTPKNM